MKFTQRLVCLVFAITAAAGAATLENCRTLKHHGQLSAAEACFTSLLESEDPFVEAEAYWALERYSEANTMFRSAYAMQPDSAMVRTEWGKLFLERFNSQDAGTLFSKAIKVDPNYAPAYLALARLYSLGYDKKAVENAQLALTHDPNFVEAHEFLAFLALEDTNFAAATEEAQKALAISKEALDAMAVLASIDWLNGKPQSEWLTRITAVNPVSGEAHATVAHFLEINRRYDEAIEQYRTAIRLNNKLWDAHARLGVNLMRLGLETEAKEQLQLCFDAHFRNAETVNSLRLLDSLGNFQTFKSNNAQTTPTVLMLHKDEAALLRPYVEPELARALSTYEQKYKMKLSGSVRLEMYPNHDDFVVRTLALPGQGGLLGVTFGQVVAMDSPTARAPGGINWASTMWHEMSHVYVVTATHSLVPRWFTEGLAVHEETAASPDWGDRMTPSIVMALQGKKLLPVEELDHGFVRPQYSNQVIVSYYQAGKICDFIVQKWGDDAILTMIRAYAARKTTAEAIEEALHEKPAAFDREFSIWLDAQTGETVRHFDEWKKGMQAMHDALGKGQIDEVIRTGIAIRNFYREYVQENSAYEMLADAYTRKGDKAAAVRELEQYRATGGDNVDTLKKLAALEQELSQPAQAEITLHKLNYIFPKDEDVHRRLGELLLSRGNVNDAVREYQAILDLGPTDMVESHYNLARALTAAHRKAEAQDQVLLSLEAAPNYKPAQKLLLQLNN